MSEPRKLPNAKFVAEVNIEGEFKVKQMVAHKDSVYLLVERPGEITEVWRVNAESGKCDKVEFVKESAEGKPCYCFCTTCICPRD